MLLVRTFLGPSVIDGIGLFAADAIRKGTPVWRFEPGFDVLLDPTFEYPGDRAFLSVYTQQCDVTGLLLLCADNMRFMNHSDKPNIDSTSPLFDPRKTDNALRDIEAGEELTCDYRLAEKDPFKGFAEKSLSNRDLAAELEKVARVMRYELLHVGDNRGPDLVLEAARRLSGSCTSSVIR